MPILAKKLVGRSGTDVLAVIENRTVEVQSVDGIGPKRRERTAVFAVGGSGLVG